MVSNGRRPVQYPGLYMSSVNVVSLFLPSDLLMPPVMKGASTHWLGSRLGLEAITLADDDREERFHPRAGEQAGPGSHATC